MSNNRNAPAKGKKRRLSPLVIIGGTILVLAVGFLLVSDYLIENRDPRATRSIAERRAETEGSAAAFRSDATLYFNDVRGDTLAAVTVEIAESEQARTQGLMGRKNMAEGQGMLFIFPTEEYRSFWMANTPLPLDIIFVNSAGSIVTIQRNTVPYSEESIPSTAPATYVVEVNAGFCDRHGVREGNLVRWVRPSRD
ncbi:MAG: DUF192 domain-containing protein [Bacteroidota bacterium]|nr:DUF192 domain-containing protein [Bacteroidota bacterium]